MYIPDSKHSSSRQTDQVLISIITGYIYYSKQMTQKFTWKKYQKTNDTKVYLEKISKNKWPKSLPEKKIMITERIQKFTWKNNKNIRWPKILHEKKYKKMTQKFTRKKKKKKQMTQKFTWKKNYILSNTFFFQTCLLEKIEDTNSLS